MNSRDKKLIPISYFYTQQHATQIYTLAIYTKTTTAFNY
jgi:hypothetical protein